MIDTSYIQSCSQEERFYPEELPRFLYEPLRKYFQIVHSSDYGDGIISLTAFQPGDIVFKFVGWFLNEQTLFSLQYVSGMYLHDPFFMGKVLHSCDPNMVCDMSTQTFTALRQIRTFELLTMDYETTEEYLFRGFWCECGSPSCKGWIEGGKYREDVNNGIIEANLKEG